MKKSNLKKLVLMLILTIVTTMFVGIVPAAAEGQVARFVIGSNTYTLDDSSNTMPVTPYISENRTLLPVRYVAVALEIFENDIQWDAVTQKVTLTKNATVVQLTIGQKIMISGTTEIALDTAPVITNNYTFLPIGAIAQAFNYNADWDAATQTITIYPPGTVAPAPVSASTPELTTTPTPKLTTTPEPASAPVPVTVTATEPNSITVYITNTGSKYHVAGCRYLARSQNPISLDRAKSQGYTACSVCRPPR